MSQVGVQTEEFPARSDRSIVFLPHNRTVFIAIVWVGYIVTTSKLLLTPENFGRSPISIVWLRACSLCLSHFAKQYVYIQLRKVIKYVGLFFVPTVNLTLVQILS